jgi:acetyl-CoA carboxylase alpha subunit
MTHGHTELSNVADNEEVDLENEVEKLKAVKETNENQMMDNIDQAQTRQKKYYNRRNVMTKEYNVGDNVLLKNF